MIKILIFSCFLFATSLLFAQTQFDRGFEYRQKIGFLAAHRGVMAHMPRETAKAIEISYILRTRGTKNWHQAYRYPTIGGTLFLGSVGNTSLMGNYVGAYGFSELPMIKTKHYDMSFKLGCGAGYTSKIYDPINNPKNVAVSTHLNAMMCFAIKSTYRFGPHALNSALDITHFSNAAFKVPNYGVNMPYLSLGYAYIFQPADDKTIAEKSRLLAPFKRHWNYSVLGIGSLKEVMPIGGKKYPVYALNFSARRFYSNKAGAEIALDVISKQAVLAYLPLISKSQMDILQVGVFAAYLVPFDHFNFVFGMGAYVRDKYQPEDRIYTRIGCRYQFSNGLMANFTLKTHWARADYLEWGLGYTFKNRTK